MTPRPILFHHGGNSCIGMLHESLTEPASLGLLIVVGGPQYRVGAHRQYLSIARAASKAGFPTFRFDWCGVGDSDGEFKGVDHLGGELVAAANAFRNEVPHLSGIVLWGLCEGASAILLHGHGLPDLQGSIVANPWIDDEGAQSRAKLKHYYLQRLLSWPFWKSLLSGKVSINTSLKHAGSTMRDSRKEADLNSLSVRMAQNAKDVPAILRIASGRDQVNKSFEEAIKQSSHWQMTMAQTQWKTIQLRDADHVFSHPLAQQQVEDATLNFLRERYRLMTEAHHRQE